MHGHARIRPIPALHTRRLIPGRPAPNTLRRNEGRRRAAGRIWARRMRAVLNGSGTALLPARTAISDILIQITGTRAFARRKRRISRSRHSRTLGSVVSSPHYRVARLTMWDGAGAAAVGFYARPCWHRGCGIAHVQRADRQCVSVESTKRATLYRRYQARAREEGGDRSRDRLRRRARLRHDTPRVPLPPGRGSGGLP